MATATFTAARWGAGRGQGRGPSPNPPDGRAALADRRRAAPQPGATRHLVLAPTAGDARALAGCACRQGGLVRRPNPTQVRDWARGSGRRAKRATRAAVRLAPDGAERHPATWRPLGADSSALARRWRRKDEGEPLSRQERNRQHALVGRPNVAHAVASTIDRVLAARDAPRRCGRTRPSTRTPSGDAASQGSARRPWRTSWGACLAG
jgi:hypothetical protein